MKIESLVREGLAVHVRLRFIPAKAVEQ